MNFLRNKFSVSYLAYLLWNKPFCLSLSKIAFLKLCSGTVQAKNIPLPLTEFKIFGNSFSSWCSPDFSFFPVFCTLSNRFCCFITLRTSSSNKSLPGSPIQVLNTLYACCGLKMDKLIVVNVYYLGCLKLYYMTRLLNCWLWTN